MGCPSEVYIGDNLVFSITTHHPDTLEASDADENPIYRVYEEETGTPILTGEMTKLDDANTVGFYTELIACTAANGFEHKKTYNIYIRAIVNLAPGTISFAFRALDGAVLYATQGAITWGQQKIAANVASQGALDIRNSHASGYGMYNNGATGQLNFGTAIGQLNSGASQGQKNYSSGGDGMLCQGAGMNSRGICGTGVKYGLEFLGATAAVEPMWALEATLTKIKKWLQLLFRKDAAIKTDNATELGEINASGGSGAGAFDNVADSVEAIRDRGDAAWATAAGFAVPGDEMDLVDDAITDIWGHSSRTLTQSAADVTAALTGSALSIKRGDTYTKTLTGLGNLSDRTKLWLTVKKSKASLDSAATLQLVESTGLTKLNSANTTAAWGSLVVDDEVAGDVTITFEADATKDLTPTNEAVMYYDIQKKTATGITTVTEEEVEVTDDVTRAIA